MEHNSFYPIFTGFYSFRGPSYSQSKIPSDRRGEQLEIRKRQRTGLGVHKKTALAGRLLEKRDGQAFLAVVLAAALALTLTLAASTLRLMYACRRFRLATLFICLPIRMNLYFVRSLRLFR